MFNSQLPGPFQFLAFESPVPPLSFPGSLTFPSTAWLQISLQPPPGHVKSGNHWLHVATYIELTKIKFKLQLSSCSSNSTSMWLPLWWVNTEKSHRSWKFYWTVFLDISAQRYHTSTSKLNMLEGTSINFAQPLLPVYIVSSASSSATIIASESCAQSPPPLTTKDLQATQIKMYIILPSSVVSASLTTVAGDSWRVPLTARSNKSI